MKKGQVSAFLLIGLVVFLIFALLYFAPKFPEKDSGFNPKQISMGISRCLEDTSKDAIPVLGKHGGKTGIELVPFNEVPAISEMENELSAYITKNIMQCIEGLNKTYFKQGYEITTENPSMNIMIGNNNIDFTLNLPATIKKGYDYKNFKTYHYNHKEIRIPYLQSIAKEILADKDKEWVDLTKYSGYDVNVEILPAEDYIIYSINNNGYIFNLGEKE